MDRFTMLNRAVDMVGSVRRMNAFTEGDRPMFTPSKKPSIAVIITSLGFVACTSQLASAGWAENHPRRAEVNARLEVQNWRINQALSHGKITPFQAGVLHTQDQFIRKEERFEANQNSGHITPAEQRALNQQENKVSGKI
jgi:hypothetical protein